MRISPLLQQRLVDGLTELGLSLSAAQTGQLLAYLELLAAWNKIHNLTAIDDPEQMVTKHLLDSLSIVPWLEGESLADIGTGAGLPGIPIAIACPNRQVRLVESNRKKTRFLREAVRMLPLANAQVIEARGEDATQAEPSATVVARAVAALDLLAKYARPWVKPQGKLLAMKGPGYKKEIEKIPRGWSLESVRPLQVPGLNAERHLVILKRESPSTID